MPKSSASKAKKGSRKGTGAPLPPFMRFSSAVRPKLKAENPQLDFASISKLVGSKWRALDNEEKTKYITEYTKEMEIYRKQKEEKRKVRKKDVNYNSVEFNSDQPPSILEHYLHQKPSVHGPLSNGGDPRRQYMNDTPYFTPVANEVPQINHPVMLNYGAPAQTNNDDECVYVSESISESSKTRSGPVPIGIFVSEYYQELVGASSQSK